MNTDKVLRIKDTVLVLASGVDDLGREILVLVPDDFAECVLDGGIVALHKVTVDELDSQTRLAWAPISLCKEQKARLTHRQPYCRQWQSFVAWERPCCRTLGWLFWM
jgi:hypothetical protein